MSKRDIHTFKMKIHHETDAAILMSDTGDEDDAVWLPKSQIEYEDRVDGYVLVEVPEWLAEDKGLI